MKIIILAAGKGERLWPLTRNTPKSLVHIGNGMTILETQLQAIARAGVSDVVIVGGYRVEQIEAKIRVYREEMNLNIDVVFNPFFHLSNNLVSLWFAKFAMEDDFIVVNGDDIFKAHVLQGLLEQPRSKEICAVISEKSAYDDDDMKVRKEGECLTHISKKIPLDEAAGESIGMIRVLGKATNAVAAELESMVRNPSSSSAPMSPVQSHPSRSVFAVACGSFQ